VPEVKRQKTVLKLVLRNPRIDLPGNLVKSATARLDLQFMKKLVKDGVSVHTQRLPRRVHQGHNFAEDVRAGVRTNVDCGLMGRFRAIGDAFSELALP
jgi:hypothetical protein